MMKHLLLVLGLVAVLVSPSWAELPSNIVFLMTFDDGNGDTVSDLSGNNNNGTIEGSVDWGDGKYGGALHFDGATHVTVPNADPLKTLTDPMSVGAWVNPDAHGGWRNIVEMDGAAGWKFGFQETHLVWTTYYVKDFSAADEIEIGQWTHVAAVWDGSEARIYVNGDEDSASPIAGGGKINVEGEPSLDIGYRSTSGSSFFEGWIDELWIANEALSQADIQKFMDGFDTLLSVDPQDKVAVTWGDLKSR